MAMDLERAVADIRLIREQLDRVETWQGFRSIAVGGSAVLTAVGYFVQQFLGAAGGLATDRFLLVWVAVAVGSASFAALEMGIRSFRSSSADVWRMQRGLLVQFFPCLFVGIVLTAVLVVKIENAGEIFPGMWGLLYGLGLASCRFHLPRGAALVSLWYLVASTWFLVFGRGDTALSMLVLFGVGQLLFAIMLSQRIRRLVDSFVGEAG